MRARFWGTRGSLPSAGPDTVRYGGNTSCVEVRTDEGGLVILDAGSGMRALGDAVEADIARIDILLSHLHLDHILGLGFFAPLFRPDLEVHLWGPSSPTMDLRARLRRYLNPPLFPVRIPDLPCDLTLHDVLTVAPEIPGLEVAAQLVCHPGPTVGYRITSASGALAYLPDHEPALGAVDFPGAPEWTSGYDLAAGADVLVHDAQYDADEYADRVGWGHSARDHAIAFAEAAGVAHLVAFHHDPSHGDAHLDAMWDAQARVATPALRVTPAREGDTVDVG